MAPLTLTLSPHELFFLPVGTPATAPAQRLEVAPHEGDTYSVLFRLVQILPLVKNDAWLYFRDERGRDDKILGGGHVCLGCSTCDGNKAKPEAITKQIATTHGTLRYWVSPEEKFGIQVSNEGAIAVATRPNDQSAQTYVCYHGSTRVLRSLNEWSPAQIEAFCSAIWSAERSPSRHFLQWQHLSDAERASIRVPSSAADHEQLLELLRCVLLLQMHHFERSRSTLLAAELPFKQPLPPATQWANRWRRALLQILAPTFAPTPPSPDPVLQARRDLWEGVRCHEAPTYHELLEAQWHLRDFLKPHLPPAETEALFRTDNIG